MSLQDVKEQSATLPQKEQDAIVEFLFQLRHAGDAGFQSSIARRMEDRDPTHWLSPDGFEHQMDKKEIR
jgi:hypothetical protein